MEVASGKGGPKARKLGSNAYATRIKQFLNFMRYGSRPGGVSDHDFAAYRPVAEALVANQEFKPEILRHFLPKASTRTTEPY